MGATGMGLFGVFHDRALESPKAKVRWFQALSLSERMDYLCFMTDLVLENNPDIVKRKNAQPVAGRIRVVGIPQV
jgi:hypothetical protein